MVYLTPQGQVFNQQMARRHGEKRKTWFSLCGHYEGIDERVLEEIVTDYVSIGDYVLTGGELPAMIYDGFYFQHGSRRAQQSSLARPKGPLQEIFWNIPVQPPGGMAWQKGSGGSYVRSSCKYREVAQRQSIIRTARRRPDLLKKGRSHQQRMEFWLRQLKKQWKEGGIQR